MTHPTPYQKRLLPISPDSLVIILVFLLSRVLVALAGIHLDYDALFRNWQYPDMDTFKHHLLRGIWYDHTQPPLFNLLLGLVVKISGPHADIVFSVLLKSLSLVNALLLLNILRRLGIRHYLPLIISLLYILSPACIVIENDLFYTSFISFLLLLSCLSLLRLSEHPTHLAALTFFGSLALICLSRSMYHLIWLLGISILVIAALRKRAPLRLLLPYSLGALLFVGFWYVKNKIIFHQFTTSTWMGMNLSRNVFHDAASVDSSAIENIEPFSKISAYNRFLPTGYQDAWKGLDDRDLLPEYKNDTLLNAKQIGYITVSEKYMQASKKAIFAHPLAYCKNVLQSAIIFFAPVTRYPVVEFQARKMKWYDVFYSFNLSHFAHGKQQRRVALTLSAIPKLLLYLLTFGWLIRHCLRNKPFTLKSFFGNLTPLQLFIGGAIGYVFIVSSLCEHFENMRFRYEIEPLFLIVAAQALASLLDKRKHSSEKGLPGQETDLT